MCDYFSDITVIVPCLNEGHVIGDAIKNFKNIGFRFILIVDGGSTDNSVFIAKAEGANVVECLPLQGFSIVLLRGLYETKTKHAFITDPEVRFKKESMIDFINFSLKGNYSLLFGKNNKQMADLSYGRSINISPILKERFGLEIPEPFLDVAFINASLMEKIKTESLNNYNLSLELIRIAMKNGLKIGTYDLRMEVPFAGRVCKRPLLNVQHHLRMRGYLKRAFPKLYKENLKNKIVASLFAAVLGYVVIRVIELILSKYL